jgi:hypothetical protein
MMGWSFPAVLLVVECQGVETHTNRGLKMQEGKTGITFVCQLLHNHFKTIVKLDVHKCESYVDLILI